jgi:nickel transport protein
MVLAVAALAFAHAAVLWAYVEDNHVYVEAFFMGGKKVLNGRIVVVDAEGKKLLEGKTNEEGKFDFPPPIMDEMTILLLLDKAHRSEFKIKKEDFQQSDKCAQEPAVSSTESPK